MGLLICFTITGCTIKQNQLVVLETSDSGNISTGNNIDIGKIDKSRITNDVQKSETLLENLDKATIPLIFNNNYSLLASMEFGKNKTSDEINKKVISGNFYQFVNIYINNIENGKKVLIGEFLSPKDYSFDEGGNNFAFVDGNNNVYIYNVILEQLKMIVEGKKSYNHSTVSWSKDGSRIVVDNRSVYDVASCQLISVAVDSYTPFILKNFGADFYLVSMRSNDYQDMLSLYDYKSRSFKTLTNGVYSDSDFMSLLYIRNDNKALSLLNLKTMENQIIERNPVYSSAILKQNGSIVYTIQNKNQDSFKRYQLVVYSPETKQRTKFDIETPSFYLSTSSDKLTFISAYSDSRLIKETKVFSNTSYLYQYDDADLNEIKNVISKMFILDYSYIGDFAGYEKLAKAIYSNSYDPLPQEALENKLLDFKKFNQTLPPTQKKFGLPYEISYNEISVNKNKASIKIDNYWTNSVELEKMSGKWKIVGFSTHPDSVSLAKIRYTVSGHLSDIKGKVDHEALRYWSDEKYSNFSDDQIKLVKSIMSSAEKYSISIGEIEFWNSLDDHRSDNVSLSDVARVKILFHSVNKDMKYKLILKKNSSGNFEIFSWNTDPLSISQLN